MDITKYPLIWCDNCKGLHPVRFDEMEAGDLNDHDAVDLGCSNCEYIVATLHGKRREEPKPVQGGLANSLWHRKGEKEG